MNERGFNRRSMKKKPSTDKSSLTPTDPTTMAPCAKKHRVKGKKPDHTQDNEDTQGNLDTQGNVDTQSNVDTLGNEDKYNNGGASVGIGSPGEPKHVSVGIEFPEEDDFEASLASMFPAVKGV